MTFLNVFPSDISAEGWSKPYTVFNLAWLFCFFVVVRVFFFSFVLFCFFKKRSSASPKSQSHGG